MRGRKSREVNIFSASVVDLFASGLGVFLIVAIIALVNQKKETSKALEGGLTGALIKEKNEQQKAGQNTQRASLDQNLISDLEEKIKNMSKKLDQKIDENFQLKKKLLNVSEAEKNSESTNADTKFLVAAMQKKHEQTTRRMQQSIVTTERELAAAQKKIEQLEKTIKARDKYAKKGNQGVGTNFKQFEIGSKFQLQNVHFYPGTENAIEPYAGREVADLANFLQENQRVTIEVSGHIFETKEAIEAGKADDEYNLSGRRAEYVCNKLVEFGISRKRLKCLGYGATRPLYMTDDQYSEEAQLNRRVEVEILTK